MRPIAMLSTRDAGAAQGVRRRPRQRQQAPGVVPLARAAASATICRTRWRLAVGRGDPWTSVARAAAALTAEPVLLNRPRPRLFIELQQSKQLLPRDCGEAELLWISVGLHSLCQNPWPARPGAAAGEVRVLRVVDQGEDGELTGLG
jgi:hypothetical protein